MPRPPIAFGNLPLTCATKPINEDGYELWLRYRPVDHAERLAQYRNTINNVVVLGTSATVVIIKSELARALPALLARAAPLADEPAGNALVVGHGG